MIALDASALYGSVEREDSRARRIRRLLDEFRGPYVTTEACLTESMYLCGSRIGWGAQDRLWRHVDRIGVTVSSVDIALVQRLMRRYRDVPMDFADATLVGLASSDPGVRIATFDSDFLAYRRDDGTPVPLFDDRLLGWA